MHFNLICISELWSPRLLKILTPEGLNWLLGNVDLKRKLFTQGELSITPQYIIVAHLMYMSLRTFSPSWEAGPGCSKAIKKLAQSPIGSTALPSRRSNVSKWAGQGYRCSYDAFVSYRTLLLIESAAQSWHYSLWQSKGTPWCLWATCFRLKPVPLGLKPASQAMPSTISKGHWILFGTTCQ